MGLFYGISDAQFLPRQNITRGELAAVLTRFISRGQLGHLSSTDQFNDIAGHWAREYINEAAKQGWVEGLEGLGGSFNPDQLVTRAEAAAMVNRVLGRMVETPDWLLDNMISWPDNSDEYRWYYSHIYMATNAYMYRLRTDGSGYKELIEIIKPRDWTVLERPDSRPEHIFD